MCIVVCEQLMSVNVRFPTIFSQETSPQNVITLLSKDTDTHKHTHMETKTARVGEILRGGVLWNSLSERCVLIRQEGFGFWV